MGPKEPSVPTNEEAQDRAARERREAAPEQAAPGEGPALAALAAAAPRPPAIGRRPPLGRGQVQALQRFGGNRALGALLARRGSEHAAPPLQGESARAALRTSDGPDPLQRSSPGAAPAAPGASVRGALQRQARRGLRASRAGDRSAIQRVTTYAVGPRKRALDEGLARVAAAHAAPVAFMAELAKLGGGAFTYLNQRYDNPTDPPIEQQRPQEDDPQAAAKNNLNQMVLSKASLKAYFVALGRLVGLIAPDADGGDYQGNVNLFTIAEGQGNKAIANFQAFLNDIADADTAKQIPWFGQDLGSPLFTYQLVKLKSGVFAYLFG